MIKFDKTVLYKGQVRYAGEAFAFDEADEKMLVKMGGKVVGEKQPVRPVEEKKTTKKAK